MKHFTNLVRASRRWAKDETGSAAVETLLVVPMLVWSLLATLTFFDGYRTETVAQRAALTVIDMVSRETDLVDHNYLDGIRKILNTMSLSDGQVDFRLTAYTWEEDKDRYDVKWSRNRGAGNDLNDNLLNGYVDQLPVLSNGDVALLLQTWTDWEPDYSIGFAGKRFETFLVLRPRFAPQVCFKYGTGDDDVEC